MPAYPAPPMAAAKLGSPPIPSPGARRAARMAGYGRRRPVGVLAPDRACIQPVAERWRAARAARLVRPGASGRPIRRAPDFGIGSSGLLRLQRRRPPARVLDTAP